MKKFEPIEGEPNFSLLARDPDAPMCLQHWAMLRIRRIVLGKCPESDANNVIKALLIANYMQAWLATNEKEKPWRKETHLFDESEAPAKGQQA